MTASQVPDLKLKWAFGLAGAKQVFGEPVVVGRTSLLQRTITAWFIQLNADSGCALLDVSG